MIQNYLTYKNGKCDPFSREKTTETNSELIHTFEKRRQDFKAAIVIIFWDIKENILVMN